MAGTLSRMDLIVALGAEYRTLRAKYPDESNPDGYRKIAVCLAMTALIEEEYRVKDWHQLLKPSTEGRIVIHYE